MYSETASPVQHVSSAAQLGLAVKDSARGSRIAEQLQRELAELIRTEVKDPGVGLVTLTGVELSRDLAHAKVFFSTLGGAHDAAASSQALNRAAGFLRSRLARTLKLRMLPDLHFQFDPSVEQGARLSALIDRAVTSAGGAADDEKR